MFSEDFYKSLILNEKINENCEFRNGELFFQNGKIQYEIDYRSTQFLRLFTKFKKIIIIKIYSKNKELIKILSKKFFIKHKNGNYTIKDDCIKFSKKNNKYENIFKCKFSGDLKDLK